MTEEERTKWPRAIEVFTWAIRRNMRIRDLHRELFPLSEYSYEYFDNILNGHRRNDDVIAAVEERLAEEVAIDLGVSEVKARAMLFPED